MSDQALFTIRPASYAAAEEALESVGCYLAPTGTEGTYAVSCSGVWAGSTEGIAERAAAALEAYRVLVYQD